MAVGLKQGYTFKNWVEGLSDEGYYPQWARDNVHCSQKVKNEAALICEMFILNHQFGI